jgi:hypothetical protein
MKFKWTMQARTKTNGKRTWSLIYDAVNVLGYQADSSVKCLTGLQLCNSVIQ